MGRPLTTRREQSTKAALSNVCVADFPLLMLLELLDHGTDQCTSGTTTRVEGRRRLIERRVDGYNILYRLVKA